MAFNEAFVDLILRPLQHEAKTPGTDTFNIVRDNPGVNTYGNTNYDDAIYRELGRGQTCCNTPTLALWYCYSYLLMHYDAFNQVIACEKDVFEQRIFNKRGDLLMIDVGCGPMTSGLAMADYHARQYDMPLKLAYVGIDNTAPMVAMAQQFAQRKDLFNMMHQPLLYSDWHFSDLNVLQKRVTNNGTLIFNFSYFFGQNNLTLDSIKELALFIEKVMVTCRAKDTFVIYLNNRRDEFQQKYELFRQELKWRNTICFEAAYQRRAPKQLGAVIKSFGPEYFRYVIVEATLKDEYGNRL